MAKSIKKMCMYTVVFGNYEGLNELPPEIASANIPKICFTDDPSLHSETWEIRVVKPAFPMDSVRSQRIMKILPHRFLSEFDSSLYVDNTVRLKTNPIELIEHFCAKNDVSVPIHSYREHVYEEFIEVARSGLDDAARVFEQMNHYQIINEKSLQSKPYWTAIMFRNHLKESVVELMENWYRQILRYSRRDQLSLNYSEIDSDVEINGINIDNYNSNFHEWPILTRRDVKKRVWSPGLSGGMPIFEKMEAVKSMEAELDKKIKQLSYVNKEIKEKYAPVEAPEGFIAERYYELNPDVKAAGADAVQHYIQFGWQEDRKWK